jgi:hypothetical protein
MAASRGTSIGGSVEPAVAVGEGEVAVGAGDSEGLAEADAVVVGVGEVGGMVETAGG